MKDFDHKVEYTKLPFIAYYNSDGYYHRISVPAIEYHNGNKEWFIDGIRVDCNSQEDFKKMLKIKAFW